MNRTCTRIIFLLVGWIGVSIAAAQAAEPLVCEVAKSESRLLPEGGSFPLSLSVYRVGGSLPDEKLSCEPSFADGWGRTLWQGAPIAFIPGDKSKPALLEITVPYPKLPPGGYLFRGAIRDAAGVERATVRLPVGRFERFDFQRELVWLYWGGGPPTDVMAKALLELGLNGGGGDAPDFRFPYRFFRDHATQVPEERFPEDVVLRPEGTSLDWFRGWITGDKQMPRDGGLVLSLMTDEVPANFAVPAMRAVRLRLARRDPWMKVPTISRFNDFFRTDFLSWDEVFRDGFPPLDHPQFKGMPIQWTADRQSYDVETPMMRSAMIRQANPCVVISPGATHCLTDGWADSFNDRAYNFNTTLDFIQRFISGQPAYGLRPANKLFNLKPGYLSAQGAYWEAHEHLYWAALANNARMFLIYGPGDGYGSLPATADGQITPEGKGFQAIRNIIHPLRPAIMATRSQLEPAVLYLDHGNEDGGRNMMDGLVANGIMPRGARAPGPETKLIFAIAAGLNDSVLEAVRGGAGLVCNGSQEALGIDVTGAAPAASAQEIDLSPLAKAFPELAGVKVMGTFGGDAKAKTGSGLDEVRVGDKLLAITGPIGKGWVLYLNFTLQNMIRGDNWGHMNMALMGDDSIPARNAALVRAMLARAGVPERVRITDRSGRVHPLVRAFAAETYDSAQRYLFIVSEPIGKLSTDAADAKKQILELACENPLTGAIRILDPAVKAVRDLRTGKILPLRTDAQGVAVDFSLVPGQGTILSLLTAPPAGKLDLRLSQPDVAGNEVVHVELSRRDAGGAPLALPGHSLWVRFLDPRGREVEALTRWATGGGPHVFTAPFALSDTNGEWTVVAEDQTDGTRAEAKLARQAKPAAPRQPFVPTGPPMRPAFAVTLDSTPYLDGDLILTEIRGTLRCSAAGATPVTIRLPVGPAGAAREVTVTSPKANADVPFAIPLWMSRAQAQAVCGLRYEGVELTVQAPGLPADRFTYRPNILPLARAPQKVGSVAGGKLAVKVNNFTKTAQRVAITLAALPGEQTKPWQADTVVAPQSSAVLERTVAGLPALTDPGLYDVALDWSVGDAAQTATALEVETVCEQEWWVKTINPLDKVKVGEMDDTPATAGGTAELDLDGKGEPAPVFPDSPVAREKAGWRRAVTQGVVWWMELTPPKFTFGQIFVAMQVVAPKDGKVRVTFFGPTPAGTAWVNGALTTLGAEAAPVALRKGRNTVVLALDLTGKNKPQGCSLALLDPATGKRDRTLRIGSQIDTDGKARESGAPAAPQSSVTIERPAAGRPSRTDAGAGGSVLDWNVAAAEPNVMALDAVVERE